MPPPYSLGDDSYNYGYVNELDTHGNKLNPVPAPSTKTIPVVHTIYDSGAMMTMVPLGSHCTDLRDSTIDIGGAFGGSAGPVQTCVSHYIRRLDDGEIVHIEVPNTIAVPTATPCIPLICHAQVQEMGHRAEIFNDHWKLHFTDGGTAPMPISCSHPMLTLQPVNPVHIAHMDYSTIRLHSDEPY